MINDWIIYNARIINEGNLTEADIHITNGRINRIGQIPKRIKKTPEIDLEGRYLIPGMIDDQVHFREPGMTHKATIESESKAAVLGGVTSFMEMPNTNPPTTNFSELGKKIQIALQKSAANYSFFFGATENNIELIKKLPVGAVAGVKIFMGSSTGTLLVDDDKALDQIFQHAPTIIATHCEDDRRIKHNEQICREKLGEDISFEMHPIIRDREACINSTRKAIQLAEKHQAPLHVLHLTTAEECQLFQQGAINRKLITNEVCIHHLYFDDRDYAKLGSLIKCNPAIKTSKDKKALREALALDKIDIIATDHAPHTWSEKHQTYFKAPSGLPLLQDALPVALELVHDKALTLTELVRKTSHNVADRFKVIDRGYIREGYWADLVAVDVNKSYRIGDVPIASKCAWTPFLGSRMRSKVFATWVSGQLACKENRLYSNHGKQLEFGKQR